MAKLFSIGKTSASPAPSQPAPGTSIHHDPTLIAKLRKDHQVLFDIYNQVQAAFDAKNFARVKDLLAEFRSTVQQHLLTENVKLYIYLSHQLASDAANAQIISEFRHEMNGIARVVMDFLRRYTEGPLGANEAAAFKKELEEIGSALVKRTQREENTLYPLYLPSY